MDKGRFFQLHSLHTVDPIPGAYEAGRSQATAPSKTVMFSPEPMSAFTVT